MKKQTPRAHLTWLIEDVKAIRRAFDDFASEHLDVTVCDEQWGVVISHYLDYVQEQLEERKGMHQQ